MPTLPHDVHLVDTDGFTLPCTERFTGPEPDATDPAEWPAWTDNFYWEPTDAAELAELEAEALADLADAPRPGLGESLWAQLMIEGSLPPVSGGAPESYEPTAADSAWLAQADNQGDDFPRDWTAAEKRQFQTDIARFYATSRGA